MKLIVLTAISLSILTFSYNSQAGWWDTIVDAANSEAGQKAIGSLNQENRTSSYSNLSNSEIGSGLREALRIGSSHVVSRLGVRDGFNMDKKIHIPLPDTFARIDSALSAVGMSALTDDLELRINRAAEIATPKAKALFITAINDMTINDAKNILTGPDNAATQYLRSSMGFGLEKEMKPLIADALASAGAVRAYDNVMGQYSKLPFMPDIKANLNDYVVTKAMDGIFYYVGQEEKAIRNNPAKRTTELLKTVFSKR